MTVAFVVTVIELLLQATYYEWYLRLGIYVPLLSMNCLILSYAEGGLFMASAAATMQKSLTICVYVAGVLLLLGGVREGMSLITVSDSGVATFFNDAASGGLIIFGLVMALIQHVHKHYHQQHDN
jgi:electron transport complex protein RnfE